ncbi:SGNH/GDSL hydrolase family protein [Nostoc sp. FACHB-110]|uniref:SGNH/GDSL hydrolase family protein n=1 Tax=Nostoc sp. FACHB-110 TaxID=2692834 RepID=UPI00168835CD|nr:SGNH/GDSL hydrolase family protein [Nostoc sp. FACHB-110]MBD2441568.1 SGNH/GDSL hydrolase family protein [Nostoc sp. FACHB-110]
MQKQTFATGLFLLSLLFPLKVSAQNYEDIYIFGDSFSDTGNVFNATNRFPPQPYFNGRFSNGPVWVEYLASDLGLTFKPNNNFAYGGATTGYQNIGLSTLPGLKQQIDHFTAGNQSANPNALYILWAGTNDYMNVFFGGIPNPSQTTSNLSAAVKSLAAVGAKDIMVVNLPDLGNFPVTGGDKNISSLLSSFTSAHNSSLSAKINSLRQQLNPDINIRSLDVNSLFNRIIAHPEEFGFTNVQDSCVGSLSVVPINIPTQPIDCTPDQFLFWDQIHPTTATHRLIGELAFSALQSKSVTESSAVLGILLFAALSRVSRRKSQKLQSRAK